MLRIKLKVELQEVQLLEVVEQVRQEALQTVQELNVLLYHQPSLQAQLFVMFMLVSFAQEVQFVLLLHVRQLLDTQGWH